MNLKTLLYWIKSSQRLAVLIILSASLAVTVSLVLLRPKPAKRAPKSPVTLVETLTIQPQSEKISVTAFGSIQADRTVQMQPQVSGRVVKLSDKMVLGGLVEKGELLLQIDDRDFLIAIEQAKAQLAKAEFDLRVEEGRQVVAKREWELLDPTIKATALGEELALRRPHLLEKKAALQSAKSKLAKAELDLERTHLRAPFDALVVSESVEVGQLLSMSSNVATLVGTDAFRVQVNLPYSSLKWVYIPQGPEDTGSLAIIKREIGGSGALQRYGHVIRLLGDLDPNGRMVRLLVRVDDPLGLKNDDIAASPLLLQTYVRVELLGPTLDDVYVIPRRAVRNGDKVWVMDEENRLEIKTIHIILGREDDVIVDRGVLPGDRLITSPLPTALPGLILKVADGPSK